MKYKKDLEILKMSKDEAITIYIFLVVVLSLFGVKRKIKSDIAYFLTYIKCGDKSFQIDSGL